MNSGFIIVKVVTFLPRSCHDTMIRMLHRGKICPNYVMGSKVRRGPVRIILGNGRQDRSGLRSIAREARNGGMPDDLTFDHVDNEFGDVGRMVCDALD